jgi:hypothetical protein
MSGDHDEFLRWVAGEPHDVLPRATAAGEQDGYPPLSRIASEIAEIEECTEGILGSAESIARICANDEDEALSILGRVRSALEVAAFWLLREEDDAKHPELMAQRTAAQYADRQAQIDRQAEIERQAAGGS